MDRATSLDSAFLHVEDRHSAMHIASLGIFEGPAPTQAEILSAVANRLPAAPRLRQRLRIVPLWLGRPVWVDDPEFNIENHVRRLKVPDPGGEEELRETANIVLSEALRHDRPLWQDVVLEGLAGNRWALLTKVHHSMVDGIAGTHLLETILDQTPDAVQVPTPRWAPAQQPGDGRLVRDAVRDQARLRFAELRSLPASVATAARHPSATARAAYDLGRGALGFAEALVPTPRSSLVGPLGRDRDFRWVRLGIDDVLRVRERLGGTVNDVVLAVVAEGFRALEAVRDIDAKPDSVRCLVPVSVRRPGSGSFDNQVSAVLLALPVEIEDIYDRYQQVVARTVALKKSHEAQTGRWMLGLADALPPAAVASFLHFAFRAPHRNLTTVVTNVPGPRSDLYLAGRRMIATYPYVPIADRLRIGIAVTSYAKELFIGVTTDRESMPDVGVLMAALDSGFEDLVALAESQNPSS